MTEAPSTDQQDRDQIIRAAYTVAGRRLREAHHEEFLKYQIAECKERGLDWSPKESPEQRATAEFDRLIEQYPHLRHRLPLDDAAPDEAEAD
jgi:hypothetical protein